MLHERKNEYDKAIELLKQYPPTYLFFYISTEELDINKEPEYWRNKARPFNYQYYNELLAEYQYKSNNKNEAENTYKILIENCIDIDWKIYQTYIDILIENNSINDDNVIIFINKLDELRKKIEERDKKSRYGLLMFIYLYYTLYLKTKDEKYIENYLKYLNEHINTYYSYTGCFHDIKPFLSLLLKNEEIHFSDEIISKTFNEYSKFILNYNISDDKNGKELFHEISHVILLLQILRYCGYHFEDEKTVLNHIYDMYYYINLVI